MLSTALRKEYLVKSLQIRWGDIPLYIHMHTHTKSWIPIKLSKTVKENELRTPTFKPSTQVLLELMKEKGVICTEHCSLWGTDHSRYWSLYVYFTTKIRRDRSGLLTPWYKTSSHHSSVAEASHHQQVQVSVLHLQLHGDKSPRNCCHPERSDETC